MVIQRIEWLQKSCDLEIFFLPNDDVTQTLSTILHLIFVTVAGD
jgi:hypothetical protein